jgi:hypothetical protein
MQHPRGTRERAMVDDGDVISELAQFHTGGSGSMTESLF